MLADHAVRRHDHGADLWADCGEGCFYLFHDPGCGLSAVVYQQS
jgi:hypothetical protein